MVCQSCDKVNLSNESGQGDLVVGEARAAGPSAADSWQCCLVGRTERNVVIVPSLFEFAGGEVALHRLEATFYASVLADPLLQPLFGAGRPHHVDHLTWFTAESFGGPDRFSREVGFQHLIDAHRGLKITEDQRQRFVDLYRRALDTANMPEDPEFRAAVMEHVEFGTLVAMQNSNAACDEQLHPIRDVPRWTWSGDDH